MTDTIAGLPFWEVRFDSDGDPDGEADVYIKEIGERGITDLFVLSHGWNNSPDIARQLYTGWFSQLAPQLKQATKERPVKVGLVGVFWPALRWSDEPIPDFKATPAAPSGGGAAAAVKQPTVAAGPPTLDADTLKGLKATFPKASSSLEKMADLLAKAPTPEGTQEFMNQMRAFADQTASGEAGTAEDSAKPGMLADEPDAVFGRFAAQLKASGVTFDDGGGGGEAGLLDAVSGVWNGAKEALRQLTYWQMKDRAGVIGEKGLGPFIGRLHEAEPEVRVNLVGHSFGARVVSYALAGLPNADPSPVKSITLLQGAFSHFAFAEKLPFDASRGGLLKGKLSSIDGPLTVCFSSHDDAVGKFYPLASLASGQDSAAAGDPLYRWGGMGHDGAQSVDAPRDELQAAGAAATYRMAKGKALNIDCSEIVSRGGPPSGAHSDIVHPELTWVALKAAGIVA